MGTRNQRRYNGENQCEEEGAQGETPQYLEACQLLRKLLTTSSAAEVAALYDCLPPSERPRTRGLPETDCVLDASTGELRCHHPRQAPGNKDCRIVQCSYRELMQNRVADRLRRALLRKLNGVQS